MEYFTMDNTDGFTEKDIVLLNAAVENLMEKLGMDTENSDDVKNASDRVNNNWIDGVNTVESLTR